MLLIVGLALYLAFYAEKRGPQGLLLLQLYSKLDSARG